MRLLLLLSSLLLLCSTASADVVGPEPTGCPIGTRGAVCHGLEYCAPRTCTASSDCGTGEICQERDLCVSPRTCGGLRIPEAAPPPPISTVSSICGGDGSCTEGTCESRMVCVTEGTPPGTDSGGCSCRVGHDPIAASSWVLGLLAVALFARRRGARR